MLFKVNVISNIENEIIVVVVVDIVYSVELIQSHPQMFSDGHQRRLSDASLQSTVSGSIDNIPLTTITNCKCSFSSRLPIFRYYLLHQYFLSSSNLVNLSKNPLTLFSNFQNQYQYNNDGGVVSDLIMLYIAQKD